MRVERVRRAVVASLAAGCALDEVDAAAASLGATGAASAGDGAAGVAADVAAGAAGRSARGRGAGGTGDPLVKMAATTRAKISGTTTIVPATVGYRWTAAMGSLRQAWPTGPGESNGPWSARSAQPQDGPHRLATCGRRSHLLGGVGERVELSLEGFGEPAHLRPRLRRVGLNLLNDALFLPTTTTWARVGGRQSGGG